MVEKACPAVRKAFCRQLEDASKHLESNVGTLKKMIHGLNRLDDSVREETFITQQVSYMSMIIVLSLKSTYLLKDMKMIDRLKRSLPQLEEEKEEAAQKTYPFEECRPFPHAWLPNA